MTLKRLGDRSDLIRAIEAEAWLDMLDAAPPAIRREFGIDTFRTENAAFVACRGLNVVPFNRGFAIGPAWGRDVAEMAEGIGWLARHAATDWVLQIDEEGLDNSDIALRALKFEQTGGGWVKLMSDVEQSSMSDDPSIEMVGDERQAADFAFVVTRGFDFPSSTFGWFKALATRQKWACFVIYRDGEPSAAGAAFRSFAGCWFGIDATLTAAQRNGLQRGLIAKRLAHFGKAGAISAVAETALPLGERRPQDVSFRNYLRAGFEPRHRSLNFSLTHGR